MSTAKVKAIAKLEAYNLEGENDNITEWGLVEDEGDNENWAKV